MSSEEQRSGPDPRDTDGGPESREAEETPGPIEEPQGSPENPDSVGEDPGVVEEPAPTPDAEPLPEEEPETAERDLAALAEELELVRAERDEYLDALRRVKAEFENSRKRQERERTRILQTASEGLVKELLPVLDNLERALESSGDIRGGVRATRDQLVGVLGKEGLLPVSSDGQGFDPTVHEAVMSQPSEEHEEGTVIQTFERGYVLNGKPIRPAKVVVAQQV